MNAFVHFDKPFLLYAFFSGLEFFLGDDFSALGLHQFRLCLSSSLHFCSGSPPDLSAGTTDWGLSGLASAADDFALGAFLARDAFLARNATFARDTSTSSHFVFCL